MLTLTKSASPEASGSVLEFTPAVMVKMGTSFHFTHNTYLLSVHPPVSADRDTQSEALARLGAGPPSSMHRWFGFMWGKPSDSVMARRLKIEPVSYLGYFPYEN